jgi:hypothetical protein
MTVLRDASFAGFLNAGDYSFSDDGGTVTVDGGGNQRSPRPWTTVTAPWRASYAGLGAEDVWAQEAAQAGWGGGDFLPGRAAALESWMLPATGAEFPFLVIPAGDWPA